MVYLPNWYFLIKNTKPERSQYKNIITTIQANITLLKGKERKTNEQYIIVKDVTIVKIHILIPNHIYL